MTMHGAKLRLGEELVRMGAITPQQLEKTLASQRATGRRLGELLVEQELVPPAAMLEAIATCLGVPHVTLRHGLIDPPLLKLIGAEEAERLHALPLFRVRGTLTVAMAEPQSLAAVDRLAQLTGCRIRPVLALEANIREFIRKYASGQVSVDAFLTSLAESDVEVIEREAQDEGPMTDLDRMVEGSPIVNLVNVAFLTAVRDRASDIHIEPDRKGTRIRYRIDGTMRDLMRPPPGLHAAIVSRVKVIGRMDIGEKRLPQEGRVRIVAEGREIDLRLSSMPTLLGEKIVARLLDKSNLRIRMSDLGLRPEALTTFTRVLKQPHGLALVTGPTGSGKTTTLYSALDLVRSPEVNIVTVEDPVEYQLDLINQIQVHDAVGLSFARALRSILRQDPDIIMVGEIRDQETARVAVQAALTGHLVLATLHTNDAPSTPARLADMGIENYLLSSAMTGVVAQRLARTICAGCATKYFPSEQVLADAGLSASVGQPFRKGGGCRLCHNTGFKGRVGVYEVLEVTPEIQRLVYRGAPAHEIRIEARRLGMLTLRDEGVRLALEGRTSLEEVLRVTRDENEEHGEMPIEPEGSADGAEALETVALATDASGAAEATRRDAA